MQRDAAHTYDMFHDRVPTPPVTEVVRHAVRGVARRDGNLLMVFSCVNGDYKFPGGGIERGESHEDALIREITEECGYGTTRIGGVLVAVTEHQRAAEDDIDVFRLVSHYYVCEVEELPTVGRHLDEYERRLAFVPRWVTVEEAIRANDAVLHGLGAIPPWTRRETWILKRLADRSTDPRVT